MKTYNDGIMDAIGEVQGWIDLHEMNHNSISSRKQYMNQKEADREHGNQLRSFKVIIVGLRKMLQNEKEKSDQTKKDEDN